MADSRGPTPGGDDAQALTADDRDLVLAAASELLANRGPGAVTLKWVAMHADVAADPVAATWPTVGVLLDAVLEWLSTRYVHLTGGVLRLAATRNEAAVIEVYQQIITRALLDGVNPRPPALEGPRNDRWVELFHAQFGLDEDDARLRLAQTFALEWGWRLFGPHIKVACGLDDRSDVDLFDAVRELGRVIIRLPPTPA